MDVEVFDRQATSHTERVEDVDMLDGLDTLAEANFRSMEVNP
ncbi:hypothetical protein WMF01_44025 [Sorangium sp. So ce1667]